MELEGVGTVTMCSILGKILWKIYNLDGLKWTFLHHYQQQNKVWVEEPSLWRSKTPLHELLPSKIHHLALGSPGRHAQREMLITL
jgi:hypothetical protein